VADCALDERPLERADLAAYLARGEKPASAYRIGAEHEKFGFHRRDLSPVAYAGPAGIHALLLGLKRFGWSDVSETGHDGGETLIGLERRNDEGFAENISLEPGGQFELSGAPLRSIHDIRDETERHLSEVEEVGGALDIGFLGLGHSPIWTRAQTPVMPKGRYDIMRAYMPKVGGLGLDMMLRTCTVQANLDFSSEADMVKKFRVSLALQPVVTALFANSPFVEGKPTGWLSTRARVWTDTDPDRTGLLDFVFQDGFGYETYVEYALDVPMYFIKRDGKYVDLSGRSFRRFLAGELSERPGERPQAKDWADHLTTLFPEVRLKSYLEMRGADCGSLEHLLALPAVWAGLLYDTTALDEAWALAQDWSSEQRHALRLDAARLGLKAQVNGRSLQAVAQDLLAIANGGLARRALLDASGRDESAYLVPMQAIAESGVTAAERLLELYHGAWHGDATGVFAVADY
jgi:glutamate--cysteine ligase